MDQKFCYCKVRIVPSGVLAYYCEESGRLHNFSKHFELKSVHQKIADDGWAIVAARRLNDEQIIYTLQHKDEMKETMLRKS